MPDREEDFRETVANIPNIKLVSIDYKNAEAVFEFTPKTDFPGAKPDQYLQRLDQLIKQGSHNTFGIKLLRTIPADKLELIEIKVVGLDCKACSLALYETINKLEG